MGFQIINNCNTNCVYILLCIMLMSCTDKIQFVLAVISYGWVTGSGEDDSKRKFYTSSENGRILGPICLVVSIVMFIATAVLRTISTKARFRQTRVGFHCPVHGDFFPISPGPDPRKFSCECVSINLSI